jgi:hypothetical protein
MYRLEDIDQVKIDVSKIQEKSLILFKTNYEPTIDEYKQVTQYILEFIKMKKRIIYGGYAQNKLIYNKNKDDIFYKHIDTPDIEFYSHEPIKDIVELCNFLYEKKCKYLQGSEGVHSGTYKLYVNFENYCDISYISKNICDTMRYIEIDGIKYAHPYFMYIDFYRIFTDPNSFSFRLDKSFNRYTRLYKYYPITISDNIKLNVNKTDVSILRLIRKKIIHNSKYIIVGKYAYNYYMSKYGKKLVNIDYYEVIILDYNKEIIEIYNKMKKIFNNIKIKEFMPYFEFFGRRMEFYLDDKIIFKVYDNNNRCIVNKYSEKKKCYFGTNQLIFLFLLSNYNYSITNNDKLNENNNLIMINNLSYTKNKYLNNKNKTVLDKTPFEDFIIECNGISLDSRRESFLEKYNKKKNNKRINFRYEPTGKQINIPVYNFDNTSGNEIINIKNLTIT